MKREHFIADYFGLSENEFDEMANSEGFALVPVEPTEKMIAAHSNAGIEDDPYEKLPEEYKQHFRESMIGQWKAAIEAAQDEN